MKTRVVLSTIVLLCTLKATAQRYTPDILGTPFEQLTIQLSADDEGERVATLIRHGAPQSTKAVLYVHGFNDYFFQREMAEQFTSHGYAFYAIDLQKYGRSLRPHQTRYQTYNIKEYFAELDSAMAIIQSEGAHEVVMIGHSTGGLITAHYIEARDGMPILKGAIFNSPFFDWYLTGAIEGLTPIFSFAGRFAQRTVINGNEESVSQYGCSLHKAYRGEWEFDTDWKLIKGNVVRLGWIRMIEEAQQELQAGFRIRLPMLVMTSDSSSVEEGEWLERYTKNDIVLDRNDIIRYAPCLGSDITITTIPGGIHDLILSAPPVRRYAYEVIFSWLANKEL